MRFKGRQIDRDMFIIFASSIWSQEVIVFVSVGDSFDGVDNGSSSGGYEIRHVALAEREDTRGCTHFRTMLVSIGASAINFSDHLPHVANCGHARCTQGIHTRAGIFNYTPGTTSDGQEASKS